MIRRGWLGGALVVCGLAAVGAILVFNLSDQPTATLPPPDINTDELRDPDLSEPTVDFRIDPSEVVAEVEAAASELSYTWTSRPLGGGGWVRGIEVHPSGDPVVARADVGGAFRFNRETETWEQLLIVDRVDDPAPLDYRVNAIALAASDPDRIYLLVGRTDGSDTGGRVLVSRDQGQSWSSSSQPVSALGEGDSHHGGERLAVSPTNADDVWLGGPGGLLRSVDGGARFDPIPTAPGGNAAPEERRGVEWVLVDEEFIYIGVAGAGVFQSADDGATWTNLWETAARPFDAELDDNGVLWAVNSEDRLVRRFDPETGEVSLVDALNGLDLRGLAVRPDGQSLVVLTGTRMWLSNDAGTTWSATEPTFTCAAIPWVDDFDFSLFTASSPEFDPLEPETLWIPEGFGVWSATGIASGSSELRCRVDGIEELVVNDLVVPSSSVVVLGNWDRALFHVPEGGSSQSTIGPTDRFNSAWDLALTPSDPQFVAAVVADHRFCCEDDGQAYQSGTSGDGGVSWEPFESYANGTHPPELRFGNIAVNSADTTNMVWLPSFNSALHYTVDGGANWVEVILPGTEDLLDEDDGRYIGGSHFQYFLRRQVLAADPITPGRFYLYHADRGVYRSDDGGMTWAVVSANGLPTGWTVGWFNARLSVVPGEEGHLLFTPGFLQEGSFSLFESTDAGVSWTAVPRTSVVEAVGYGAPTNGSDRPTVYIVGTIDGVAAIYRSSDMMNSWELVDHTAGGIYNAIAVISGDPVIPGRVYVGLKGSSLMQGDVEE